MSALKDATITASFFQEYAATSSGSMTNQERDRQLEHARACFLADDRPAEEALPSFEWSIARILQGHEIYVLGLETKAEWR